MIIDAYQKFYLNKWDLKWGLARSGLTPLWVLFEQVRFKDWWCVVNEVDYILFYLNKWDLKDIDDMFPDEFPLVLFEQVRFKVDVVN